MQIDINTNFEHLSTKYLFINIYILGDKIKYKNIYIDWHCKRCQSFSYNRKLLFPIVWKGFAKQMHRNFLSKISRRTNLRNVSVTLKGKK